MQIFKRLLYLGYYFKKLDSSLFIKFLNFGARESGKIKLFLLVDTIYSSLRYNVSLLEYFQFGFYKLKHIERLSWAGTGYMYEYHHLMNPVSERPILSDKIRFSHSYKKFIQRSIFNVDDLKNNGDLATKLISNSTGKIVFKSKTGNCGKQVEIKKATEFTPDSIVSYMNKNGYDMVEDFIVQHEMLHMLSPNSVNTIRVFSNLNHLDEVDLLGCRLRLGIDKNVDNLAAGGIVAAINEDTGVVMTDGFYSDITLSPETKHPISGLTIKGFEVPFWKEVIEMIKETAQHHPQNRSVGWDVAITESGPELIEGNHDWCKLVYQLPMQKGLKEELEKYKAGVN